MPPPPVSATIALLALLLPSLATALRGADALLVEDGQPRAQIVVAERPARMTKLAAQELQTYLRKISGATLPIVTQPKGTAPRILVGRSRFTEELHLATDGLGDGAFRMASGPDWLALLGPDEDYVPIEPWGHRRGREEARRANEEWDAITGDTFWNHCGQLYTRYHRDLDVWDYDDTGTLNAVHEFLRGLGVRWFAPGELGEVVPETATIPLPAVDRIVRPDFALRKFMFYTDHSGLGEKGIWMLRLGLNQGHTILGVTQPCHGIKFVLWREEMKKAHPEMYLTIGGKRDTTHHGVGVPDLLSPVLFEKHVRYARAMFDHFRQPALSIDLVDGYSGLVGDAPEWRAQLTPGRGWSGSMSDHAWGYLNRVALALLESHPDRVVCGLAYGSYKLPPEAIAQLSPNLAIIETRTRMMFWDEGERARHRDLREAWLAKLPSGRYFTWDSYSNARPDAAGHPVVFTRQIVQDLRQLKGVTMGEMIEIYDHPAGREDVLGYDPLALEHLHLYLTSRYWWDTNQDLDAVLADYCRAYYGPAAAEMRAFLYFCESNWMHMTQDGGKIGRAFDLLAAAQAAVGPQSAYGRRIARIARLMKPMHSLRQQLGRRRSTKLAYRVLLTENTGGKPMGEKPLDGKVQKEYWTNARAAELQRLAPDAPKPKAWTGFQIQREGDILHIGIVCGEPDMRGLRAATTAMDDRKLFAGDFVSVLLETPSRSYYEIAVNPAGAVFDADYGADGPGLGWTSGARVAVHRGDGRWSVEIRLPILGEGARLLDPSQGIDGAPPRELFPWYFNVCRQRVRGADVERTAYSPTGTDEFRVPERFAKLWGR